MKPHKLLFLLISAMSPLWAFAGPSAVTQEKSAQHASLKVIAQKAVLNSPEVTSKWHNYKAASEEIGVAAGGFLPRVDLTVGKGRESLEEPPAQGKDTYGRTNYVLSLNQMLFDGFATRNEVRKLDKAKLVRYYELLEASENVALEAAKAYMDVLRYRFLMALAEDNYVQHKATYEQILRKTQSGVGRRVDLEQAGSRLALAEVNLTTESANLHDVTARYQRLVGELPPDVIYPPALAGNAYPRQAKEALDTLYRKSPVLLAAIENVESAQYGVHARRAAYSPKLDFRVRTDNSDDYKGTNRDRVNNVAELVVTWNLFNGGADRARERQYIEQKNVALDLREKACRDTRQTLLIAHNDVVRLREQASFLALQVSLLEKTRDAYRDQFNVGQRTLLDLLDTENELLSARRSAVNADTDLTLAYFRTYAAMGTLLEFLGLQKLDVETPGSSELAQVDVADLCPSEPVLAGVLPREQLDARAMAMVNAGPERGLPAVQGSAVPAPLSGGDPGVAQAVRSWAEAWSSRDLERYQGFYAATFTPDGGLSREDWALFRRGRILPRGSISVEIHDLQVRMEGEDRALAEFRQVYHSSEYSDVTRKTLEMIKQNGKWLINRESSVPCAGNTVGGCK